MRAAVCGQTQRINALRTNLRDISVLEAELADPMAPGAHTKSNVGLQYIAINFMLKRPSDGG